MRKANGKAGKAQREPSAATEPEKEVAAGDSLALQDACKQMAIRHYKSQKREWLRSQLVQWWANAVGEIETLQTQLREEAGELFDAFTQEERRNLDTALEECWDALTNGTNKPQCVPGFLKVQPMFLSKPEGAK